MVENQVIVSILATNDCVCDNCLSLPWTNYTRNTQLKCTTEKQSETILNSIHIGGIDLNVNSP